ncbi:ribonuclease H-like domain-containing protein [Tanacetum coccineum]|uniref:Ribonuclease H-like domain-containing protein n=1 Tax=Tanacetum coccineum TaxID=301880 RepID=A0ABQ5GME4_9ASTR
MTSNVFADKRLVKLEVKGCEGGYEGIKAICECCQMLEELTFCNHRMEDGWLSGISYCENLRSCDPSNLGIKESYFQKIESIVTILTSLDSHVNDEDVHYALEGLLDKYDQVCGFMHHKDTFPDLKTARSMLITEEMRLKSKSLALPLDSSSSSSPMVLMAESGTTRRSSTTNQVKSWRPCFNFAKGAYHTSPMPYAGPTVGQYVSPAGPLPQFLFHYYCWA